MLFSILGDKIDVNFNQNDDELSLESISIPTEGDIDFNSLVKTIQDYAACDLFECSSLLPKQANNFLQTA